MKKICSEILDVQNTNALKERVNYKLKFATISIIAIFASLTQVFS
jgi:hypothetical protein